MSSKLLFLTLSFGLVLNTANVFADDFTKKKDEPKETVKTGILASQFVAGLSQKADVDTSGSTPGDEGGVLGANVSVDDGTCVVKVMNNGKKTYSVSYELIGKDSGGVKRLTRFFSSTIGPGKSAVQKASGCNSQMNLFVNVTSAKAL